MLCAYGLTIGGEKKSLLPLNDCKVSASLELISHSMVYSTVFENIPIPVRTLKYFNVNKLMKPLSAHLTYDQQHEYPVRSLQAARRTSKLVQNIFSSTTLICF